MRSRRSGSASAVATAAAAAVAPTPAIAPVTPLRAIAVGSRSALALAALGLLLVAHAEAGGRHRLEPLVADRLAARLARAVAAVVEAPERTLDVGELGLDLLED